MAREAGATVDLVRRSAAVVGRPAIGWRGVLTLCSIRWERAGGGPDLLRQCDIIRAESDSLAPKSQAGEQQFRPRLRFGRALLRVACLLSANLLTFSLAQWWSLGGGRRGKGARLPELGVCP